MGLPSFILLLAVAITNGDTTIINALAFLGGFTGILGGITLLIIVGLLTNNFLQCKPEYIHIDNCNSSPKNIIKEVIAILERVPGMTPAHHKDFNSSQIIIRLQDGSTVRTWRNLVGVDHIFLADRDGRIIYGGFVGWIHTKGLNQAINKIRQDYS